jgi:hypothetical protein
MSPGYFQARKGECKVIGRGSVHINTTTFPLSLGQGHSSKM